MKLRDFFQQTRNFLDPGADSPRDHLFAIDLDDIPSKLATIRKEANECTAYLEELFKSPRIDRNMVKIVRAIQNPVELVLFAYEFELRPKKAPAEPEADSTPEELLRYCRLACTMICTVLDLLVDLFSGFIDKDSMMPWIYYFKRTTSYRSMWDNLMEGNPFPAEVIEELNWLKKPFDFDDTGRPLGEMSYREMEYMESVAVGAFNTLYGKVPQDELVSTLHTHLWNNNFNWQGYAAFTFYQEIEPLRELPLQEQIPAVVKVINRVRQRKRSTTPAFFDEPPLKDYIMRRLTDYLDGLKLRLSTGRFLGEALPPEGRPQQLKINLPPEKLGYLLRYLQEHQVVAGMEPGVLLNFVCTFFQPAKGGRYMYEILSAAYHANPVISEHNVKRLLDPHQ